MVEIWRHGSPWQYLLVCTRCFLSGQTWIDELLLIALLVICVLQRLAVKPNVKKLLLITLSWFISFAGWWSNLVLGILDRLMVKPICYASNWFWSEGPMNGRSEEYCWKPKLLFILAVSVNLRFEKEEVP